MEPQNWRRKELTHVSISIQLMHLLSFECVRYGHTLSQASKRKVRKAKTPLASLILKERIRKPDETSTPSLATPSVNRCYYFSRNQEKTGTKGQKIKTKHLDSFRSKTRVPSFYMK